MSAAVPWKHRTQRQHLTCTTQANFQLGCVICSRLHSEPGFWLTLHLQPFLLSQDPGCTHGQQQGRSLAIRAHSVVNLAATCKEANFAPHWPAITWVHHTAAFQPSLFYHSYTQLCPMPPKPRSEALPTQPADNGELPLKCSLGKRRNQSTSEAKKPIAFKFQHV